MQVRDSGTRSRRRTPDPVFGQNSRSRDGAAGRGVIHPLYTGCMLVQFFWKSAPHLDVARTDGCDQVRRPAARGWAARASSSIARRRRTRSGERPAPQTAPPGPSQTRPSGVDPQDVHPAVGRECLGTVAGRHPPRLDSSSATTSPRRSPGAGDVVEKTRDRPDRAERHPRPPMRKARSPVGARGTSTSAESLSSRATMKIAGPALRATGLCTCLHVEPRRDQRLRRSTPHPDTCSPG